MTEKVEDQPDLPFFKPIILRMGRRIVAGLMIEQISFAEETLSVAGWTYGNVSFLMHIGNHSTIPSLERYSRQDVARFFSLPELEDAEFGFRMSLAIDFVGEATLVCNLFDGKSYKQLEFPSKTWGIPRNKPLSTHKVRVLKENACKSEVKQLQCPANIRANIEEIIGPKIRGWVVKDSKAPESLIALVNKQQIPLSCIWRERQDVAEALQIAHLSVGFECELPGYAWENVPEGEAMEVLLLVDQYPICTKSIKFTREQLVRWIEAIPRLIDAQNHQYDTLFALEHLHYSGATHLLSPEASLFMRDFAEIMNLVDFAPPLKAQNDFKEETTESVATLMYWKALRILNERLIHVKTSQSSLEVIVAVMHEMGLEGKARENYLDSIVAFACKHGFYIRLLEITDNQRWERYEQTEDPWNLTIALPALIVTQQILRATHLLWKLAKCLDRGWINTECIHFAVRELSRQSREGRSGSEVTEKFRYGVIGFLDAFRGEWFSRLHDLELIQTAVALLDDWSVYPDYFRRDLIKGLIRNYGLSPTFWRVSRQHYPDFYNVELERAYMHWKTLHTVLELADFPNQRLDALIEPLGYFRHVGNPEAVIFLREIVTNALPALNSELTSPGRALLGMLLQDPTEGVRLAAFPLADTNCLQEQFPECGKQLLTTLRELSPRPMSVFYEAQCVVGRLIREILDAWSQDDEEIITTHLETLRRHAVCLNTQKSGYVATDLLTFCYECHAKSEARNIDLLALEQAINKVIIDNDVNEFLPAPVQAALARLRGRVDQDHMLRALLTETRRALQQKFSDKHEWLFEKSRNLALTMPSFGFPRDTLVVVYSCRKYLDTRIEKIRSTWIKDLKMRGIPYLILVGDGDDAIHGDVLALDVSDWYEDLPKKTLKLIEWVLEETDFQYLYKIDDDCCLDVSHFFDTLSYRKHFYYGRVIQRSIGSMDRTWHQSKSYTRHAQKMLDKSPEPSIYADGGGGYSLSRLAMQQLHKMRHTEEGRRLLAVSLMEDKLVGDLLARAGIQPSNEDYHSYQRRRTFNEARPVGMWENILYSSAATPTIMTHLDTDDDFEWVWRIGSGKEIWPKKLWPTASTLLLETHQPKLETHQTNQLELLSSTSRFREMIREPFHVLTVVRNEIVLLPHFLDHYRKFGVCSFIIVDNLSTDGSREYLLNQPDVILFSVDTEYKHSHYGVAWQQTVLGNLCLGKWVLLADADEFLVYPDCENKLLADFITEVEIEGANCVCTFLIDMYPLHNLDEADFSRHPPFDVAQWFDYKPLKTWRLNCGWFSNSVNLSSTLRHRIAPSTEPYAFVSQKFALFRAMPWLRVSEGIHYIAEGEIFRRNAWFAHFKYHAGFQHKVETEIRRGQHFDNAKEYRRYALMLAESQGCFGDEKLSVKFENSNSFLFQGGTEENL